MSRDNLTLNEEAAVQIMEEIATDADSLRSTFIDMECAGIKLEGSSLAIFRVFAEKIGWMAELGVKRIAGFTPIRGDAEDWLLSPISADAMRATQKPKGTAQEPEVKPNKGPWQKPKHPVVELLDAYMAMGEDARRKLLDSISSSTNQSVSSAQTPPEDLGTA